MKNLASMKNPIYIYTKEGEHDNIVAATRKLKSDPSLRELNYFEPLAGITYNFVCDESIVDDLDTYIKTDENIMNLDSYAVAQEKCALTFDGKQILCKYKSGEYDPNLISLYINVKEDAEPGDTLEDFVDDVTDIKKFILDNDKVLAKKLQLSESKTALKHLKLFESFLKK